MDFGGRLAPKIVTHSGLERPDKPTIASGPAIVIVNTTTAEAPPDFKRDVVMKQQWNFSPDGSTEELEDYRVDLRDVSALELIIQPRLRQIKR